MRSRIVSVRVYPETWLRLERMGRRFGTFTASETILRLIDDAAQAFVPGEPSGSPAEPYFPPVRHRRKRTETYSFDQGESMRPGPGSNVKGKCKDCEVLKNQVAFLYERHGNVASSLETHDKQKPAETAVTPPAQNDHKPAKLPGEEPKPPTVVDQYRKMSRDLAEFKHNIAYLMGMEPYSPPSTSPRT